MTSQINQALGRDRAVESLRIVAVGSPQGFRTQIARALETDNDEVDWVPSVIAAEELLGTAPDMPDVLVLSPSVKEADALSFAESVARTSPSSAVVLVREWTENDLLPAAMRAGVRDVVDLSQGNAELREALLRAIDWSSNVRSLTFDVPLKAVDRKGYVVSIFSSKGGTGKTFLTCNLAAAIAERSQRETALVDLDLDLGDVFSYWGSEPKHPIQDLISLGDSVDHETMVQTGTKLTETLWGFGAPPDPTAEVPSGAAIGKVLRNLRANFGFVVVDATAEYSDAALATFDVSDTICLIAALDVVGIKHLSKALETLTSIGIPRDRLRVVLNRADSKVGLDAEDVQRVLKIKVDAMIPSSRLVPMSLNKGRPVYLDEPKSPVARSIGEIADKVISLAQNEGGADPQPVSKRRLFGRN